MPVDDQLHTNKTLNIRRCITSSIAYMLFLFCHQEDKIQRKLTLD